MAFPKNFTELIGVRLPIIQAPMAGSSDAELVIAVSESPEAWARCLAQC